MAEGKKTHTGYRNSGNGQFISKTSFDHRKPDTVEKVRIPNPGRGNSK